MTPEEAISGIKELQAKYGRKYKGRDLNPHWQALLLCSARAFNLAIGRIKMHCNRLPKMDYVMETVRRFERTPDTPTALAEIRDQGAEALRLLRQMMCHEITAQQYIQGLYDMSRRFGDPLYAQEAHDFQQALQSEGEPCTEGELQESA